MIWIFYTIPCALNIIGVIVAFYLSYQKLEKSDPFEKIWKEVVIEDNVCPRDAESYCHLVLYSRFSENVLIKAMMRRRGERSH